jgi:hypothetical protein
VRSFLYDHLVFTQTLRVYSCALIVRSRAVDPRRTASMIENEENTRQYFEELKDNLPRLSPRWWKKDFKHFVDKFIEDRLIEKEFVDVVPCENEHEEEQDAIDLHRLRRLVAGAAQEWELVQQPRHAARCAKLDGALVWQGRGYVGPILHAISSLQLPFNLQS